MAIKRRELIAGAAALAGMLWAGPAAFGSDRTVARISELGMRNKSARIFSVDGTQVLVYRRTARRFSGFVATCTSDQTSLSAANVRGGRITCPTDGVVFNVSTGRRVSGPDARQLTRVPLKVANGFLVATIGAVAGPAPDLNQLVASSEVVLGGGTKVESRFGTLMIVQPRRGQFTAYSARCTHFGCEVNQATATAIICTMPCGHGSQFSTSTGQVIVGPARDPLRKFDVVERNGMLFLA